MPELFDTTEVLPSRSASLAVAGEPEVLAARRAFSVAQGLLSGSPLDAGRQLEIGWYDSSVNPETGSFALIDTSSGLDDLIGEIVRVTVNDRSVFAYVLSSAGMPTPFALARRPFLAICRLSVESVQAQVVAVE